jgi:hypothetical protein
MQPVQPPGFSYENDQVFQLQRLKAEKASVPFGKELPAERF